MAQSPLYLSHTSHLQSSNIGYLVEAKQARGAIWLGDHFRPIMGSASAHCSSHRSHRLPLSNPSVVLLTASFFLFTIILSGDENRIFQLIVALFACLLLIVMEMMVMVIKMLVMVLVMVRIKGINW